MRIELAELPKAVLHDHLDGGLRVETVIALAEEAGYEGLPSDDAAELAEWFHQGESGSLERYLAAFEHTIAVMQTAPALERVAFEAVEDLAADGVVYAELRFGPLLHTRNGLTPDAVFEAVLAGIERGKAATGIEAVVIATAIRTEAGTEEVANAAADFVGSGVVGFDLAGPEAGYPPSDHLVACRTARRKGLSVTIHAGEGDGPHGMWQALALCGADRIGHGARLTEAMECDDGTIIDVGALGGAIRDRRVPLELCITSNLHTGMYRSAKEHPLGALYRAGFNVTINTDNRLMSGTSVTQEYALAAETFNLTASDLGVITVNAVAAGFGDWMQRRRLIDEVVRPAYDLI